MVDKKSWFMILFFAAFLLSKAAFAGFEGSVSQTTVPEGESFQLYLRQDGDGEAPDISVLKENFVIVGQRKSYRSSYVNGKTDRFNENVLTLIPKKTGTVILPSIRAGKEKTAPVTLTVVAAGESVPASAQTSADAKKAVSKVFMKAAVTDKQLYVAEQVPYTVKLYSLAQTPLLDGSVQPPSADGVSVEPWGDVKRSREKKDGAVYDVLEYKFLLFPQKSGKIDLAGASFQGLVSDPEAQEDAMSDMFGSAFFSGFFGQKKVSVRAKNTVLDVKPIPADAGKGWLPATNVSVSEDIVPSASEIPLGEALTRTVTLMVHGARDTQIPDVVFAAGDGYKQYPGKVDSKNLFDQYGIVGVKTRQIVFMPTKTGKLVLPSLEIPWFNTKTGRMEKAVLPSRTVTVTGTAEAVSSVSVVAPSVQTASVPVAPEREKNVVAQTPAAFMTPVADVAEERAADSFWKKIFKNQTSPERLFAAGILAGAAAAVAFWLILHLAGMRSLRKQGENRVLLSKRALQKRLKEACAQDDAERVKNVLTDLGRLYWPENPPLTLSDLAKCFGDDRMSAQLEKLNSALYGTGGAKSAWTGRYLWDAFKTTKIFEKEERRERNFPVPPLYPDA